MEDLYQLIQKLEEDKSIEEVEYLSRKIPIVQEIGYKAGNLLITKEGTCNWDNIDWLEYQGVNVFAVEKDRFGWLIGGISTKKGIITYG